VQRIVLHLDMNSYFASVEQQVNPSLRGRPVGVCSTMGSRGCIIASSREAKAIGIKTGCRISEARELCPTVVLVQTDPAKYRSTTRKVFDVLKQYSDDVEPYSIDEAFVNLTGYAHSFEKAAAIAGEIKTRVFCEVGDWLSNSVGIGSTRWLAKFASDVCEKGKLLVLQSENLHEHLKSRTLTEAWGIAEPTARKLNSVGIYTLDQLASHSPHNLMRIFGVRGYALWASVNGIETTAQRVSDNILPLPKSIGHSHMLLKRCHDLDFHRGVLMRLVERTGRRLRTTNLVARGVFASVGFENRESCGGNRQLGHDIRGSKEIFDEVWQIIGDELCKDTPISFAVGVFQLAPETPQQALWPMKTRPELHSALDTINDRYGDETIIWGTLSGLGDSHAPDRIGFRKTVPIEPQAK
jgi:DNA polymerase IV